MTSFWIFFAGMISGLLFALVLSGVAIFKIILDQATGDHEQIFERLDLGSPIRKDQ